MTQLPGLFIPEKSTEPVCIADVAVPLPLEGFFSYRIPLELEKSAQSCVRVRVPFRNREITGYIVDIRRAPADGKLKSILEILDTQPVFSAKMKDLTRWIADFYGCSWGEAIENALPKWVKFGKKAEKALQKALPTEASKTPEQKKDLVLSNDQEKALQALKSALELKTSKPFLLFGVTGSGKSELYIRIIREVLKKEKTAICMVPEIALTEQLRHFFIQHFGPELEILHSKLTDSERFLAWKRIETGTRKIVLGPRSSVFAPLPNLGLIIMDEEHEGSYKQETSPRYHAREVAAWRAQSEGALFVMGTATPSMETMYACDQKKYEKLELRTRIDDRAMPAVSIVDLKHIPAQNKRMALLSPKLLSEIQLNLQQKQGTMLLLNRRGFSTHIHCSKCGHTETCKSCQVSLTFHQEDNTLLCHYCNYQKSLDSKCVSCGMEVLKFTGFGTERVESEVAARFPQARIARLDADTVKKRGSHEEILSQFRNQKTDILVGTQMIAKGFDFPHVTLVGVILADVGLSLPDFRSAERTFQLMTQVAGRAGRGKLPGRVVIQTFSPDHPAIQCSRTHDYEKFYTEEAPQRAEFRYPPYSRLINIILRSKIENKSYAFGRELRAALQSELTAQGFANLEIIGPAPLPFFKLRGHFRWHLMLKTPDLPGLTPLVRKILYSHKKPSDVAFALDIDPLNIL